MSRNRSIVAVYGRATSILVALAGAWGCATSGGDTFDMPKGGAFADAGTLEGPDSQCSGLSCQQLRCADGVQTTVTGVVYNPAGTDPIYDALVYVPSGDLVPFASGVSCDRCGATSPGATSPLVATLSRPDGSFTLENVPAGDAVPIVIQVGRWRRRFYLPTVMPCATNAIPAGLTHLPTNRREGDIPKIAIATGAADPLECLLRKIGIDDGEFTTPSGAGSVHVYTSNGASMAAPTPPASELWSSPSKLSAYDMVLLPCEGKPVPKSAEALDNLIAYTSAGGRVFTTHYGYVWIEGAPAPFNTTATWGSDAAQMPDPLEVSINTAFPKGQALSQWLSNQGALDVEGHLQIAGSRRDAVGAAGASIPWLVSGSPNASLQEYTFNTPVGVPAGEQCGRVSYSDFHVSSGGPLSTSQSTFPAECVQEGAALSPQERVLEFMLFDLASCIQLETDPTPMPG